jgi:phosphopantothenoylcysteine decarboxylase/phosphopantothenate--cysteine ligase
MNSDTLAAIRQTKLLVGVCGAIAAMGTPHALIWARTRLGLTQVRVVMTPMAQRMVTKPSLEAAVDGPVATSWDDMGGGAGPHVQLAGWADAILIQPATANFLAKLAHGIADDPLSSITLAADCPIVVAPSMNPSMWSNRAVQRNVEQVRADGIEVIAPGAGLSLASGEVEGGSIEDVRRPILVALSRAVGGLVDVSAALEAEPEAEAEA